MNGKASEQQQRRALALIRSPVLMAHALGYPDMREDVHGKWMNAMLGGTEDMTLQAHRGSYKTTCLCIAMAYMLILKRKSNIIFLRKTDSDVAEVIKNVSRICEHPVFRAAYCALTGAELETVRATANELTLNCYKAPRGAAQLMGIGIGGSLTGKHADIVITDDIVNLRDRVSRAERDRTKAAYMELQNIRNRGGRIINTGTPWHKEDAFTLMPEARKFDCYQTGLLSKEQLQRLRSSMSPSLFAANYELRHIAQENAMFDTVPRFTDDARNLINGIAHVDCAYGGEDYTAFTCGRKIGDTLYLYGRMWHSHVDTCMDAIAAECKRLMCEPLWCEDNADKGYGAKEFRSRGLTVHTYKESMNKYVKISTYLKKWWDNIIWLKGTDPEYLAQIMDYTDDAEHDDAPDSAAVICRRLDRNEWGGVL